MSFAVSRLAVMLMVVGAQEQPCTFQVGWGGESVHLIELRPDSDTAVLAREYAKSLPADAVGIGCDAAAGKSCVVERIRLAMEVEKEQCATRSRIASAPESSDDDDDNYSMEAVIVFRGDTFRNGLRTCTRDATRGCSGSCLADAETAALQLGAFRSVERHVARPLRAAGFAVHLLAVAYAGCALDAALWRAMRAADGVASFAVETVERAGSTQATTAARALELARARHARAAFAVLTRFDQTFVTDIDAGPPQLAVGEWARAVMTAWGMRGAGNGRLAPHPPDQLVVVGHRYLARVAATMRSMRDIYNVSSHLTSLEHECYHAAPRVRLAYLWPEHGGVAGNSAERAPGEFAALVDDRYC